MAGQAGDFDRGGVGPVLGQVLGARVRQQHDFQQRLEGHRVDDRGLGADHHVGRLSQRKRQPDRQAFAGDVAVFFRRGEHLADFAEHDDVHALRRHQLHEALRVRPGLRQPGAGRRHHHHGPVELLALSLSPVALLLRRVEFLAELVRHAGYVVDHLQIVAVHLAVARLVAPVIRRFVRVHQQPGFHRAGQVDEALVLARFPEKKQHQFGVVEQLVRHRDDAVDVRVRRQHFGAGFFRVDGDVIALILQARQHGTGPQRVAIGAQAHHGRGFFRDDLDRDDLAAAGRFLAVDLQERILLQLVALFVDKQGPVARHLDHGNPDVVVDEIIFVIRIAVLGSDVRIQLLMRQVQDQVPAHGDQAPPLGERVAVILDVLQRVAAEHGVEAAVGEQRDALAVAHQVRLHVDAEQPGVLARIQADEMRKHLARPAADVQAGRAQVGHQVVAALGRFVALRVGLAPGHV